MAIEPKFPLKTVDQVCVVVDNLQRTVERYWSLFGIGPWRMWTYGSHMMKELTYRGRPADYRMKIALAKIGPLVYEVIEPVAGETIYADFLAAHGPGLQHLGVFVEDIDAAIAVLRAAGYDVLQSGRGYGLDGDGAYAYVGTDRDLAAVFELIQPPLRRRPPEASYPE